MYRQKQQLQAAASKYESRHAIVACSSAPTPGLLCKSPSYNVPLQRHSGLEKPCRVTPPPHGCRAESGNTAVMVIETLQSQPQPKLVSTYWPKCRLWLQHAPCIASAAEGATFGLRKQYYAAVLQPSPAAVSVTHHHVVQLGPKLHSPRVPWPLPPQYIYDIYHPS